MAGELYNGITNSNLAALDRADQEASGFGASSLLGLGADKLPTSTVFRENRGGFAEGEGKKVIPIEGTDSIFNPFYVFRYAKFGAISGQKYDSNLHRNVKPLADSGSLAPVLNFFTDKREKIENPSASTIIDWSQNVTDDSKKATTLGPTPYQWSDFLWCKWYGKIPNNRLLTLRRYPIPVEDNLQIAEAKMPLIPIAQAVTWWGEGTNNTLSTILGMTYGFKWEPISFGEVQNIAGNEVEASAVLDAFGLTDQNTGPIRQVLLASLFDNPSNPFESTGYDSEINTWIQGAHGKEGPYWHRVLGPVNVIENTQVRKRGFNFTHDIVLNFSYKLRAYSQVNPKVAFLDLISNFLSLTHNNAEFYGGAIRYFQKTGYIVPGLDTNKFELGDFTGGIIDVLGSLYQKVETRLNDLKVFVDQLVTAGIGTEGDAIKALKEVGGTTVAQNVAGSWVKNLIQKPLLMRSFLDGRAVGEWHLTVGNPLDPIAVIGNLCLSSTDISFSESLGLDDFPTEVNFKVTLKHGRDRAKQDILSMFNLGGGSMTFTDISPTSSAYNSYGDRNSTWLNSFYKDINIPDMSDTKNIMLSQQNIDGTVKADVQQVVNDAALTGVGQFSVGQNVSIADANAFAEKYGGRVRKAYGNGYASSPILADYFRDLKMKD